MTSETAHTRVHPHNPERHHEIPGFGLNCTHCGEENCVPSDESKWCRCCTETEIALCRITCDALAEDVASLRRQLQEAVESGYAPLPVVAYKGAHDTDVSMFERAARNLENNYPAGGSNLRDAIVRLIRREIARATPGRATQTRRLYD